MISLLFFLFSFTLLGNSIKLGLIESDQKLIDVCNRAIADAKASGQCSEELEILNRTGCLNGQQAVGSANVADLYFHEHINGAIVSRCDEESREASRLAFFWNIPIIVRSGTTVALSDREFYPTVTQITDVSAITMGQALVQFLRKIEQTEVVMAGPTLDDVENVPFMAAVKEHLQRSGIGVRDVVEIDESQWDNAHDSILRLRTQTKLLVIDAEFGNLANVLNTLNLGQMGKDGYLIVLLCPDVSNICSSTVISKFSDANPIVLSPLFEDQQNRINLISNWIKNAFDDTHDTLRVLYADYLAMYNACFGFCFGTTLTNPSNGRSFTESLRSKSFGGKLGTIRLDAANNAIQEFVFQRLNGENWTTVSIARALPTECTVMGCSAISLIPQDFRVWEGRLRTPLAECVYSGAGCTNYTPWLMTLIVLIIGIIVGILFYFYRRQKRLDVFRMHWKIPKAQVKVIENKQSKSKVIPAGDESKASTLVSKRRIITAYALIGTSKAEFMVLKQMKKIRYLKPELKFISELKRINHDNLTTFLGICYNEGDRFYVLHNLVERASLDNFIGDQDFTMDSTFKSAFLRDIITGLQYLHKSPVGYHGLLSSQNCLIDANWVLKLTNFGVSNLLNSSIEKEAVKLMEIIPFHSYLTSAPENLSEIGYGRMFPRGSRQGDIYSFGMLLYHIVFRRQPFENYTIPAKEIIDEVKRKAIKPDVEDALPEEKPLIDIMEQCWSKEPDSRPKLRVLNQVISSTFESSKGNLIDQMIRMNYSYAQHLERIVNERTAEFETQKRTNARLLRQMLPASIAEKLMAGESVEPRSYEAATVLFCQLVDFGRFLSQTAPHSVIRFLNDVFTRFDEVIGEHDAYKVETTGETYMVASGVPQENDNRHVFEISEIALKIRELCSTYTVEHIADWKVQVRIGYHCGPIAAGVVGVKAPRFCLFGDTVNFASRMQSNCPPNQIQMSEPTALLLMPEARYKLTKRGIVRVKGKGDVNTYWLNEHLEGTGTSVAPKEPERLPNGPSSVSNGPIMAV